MQLPSHNPKKTQHKVEEKGPPDEKSEKKKNVPKPLPCVPRLHHLPVSQEKRTKEKRKEENKKSKRAA